MPFLCLSIFQLCDASNNLHTILRQDCLALRDDVCAEQWSQAVEFLGARVLPVCEDLPDITIECQGSPRFIIRGNLSGADLGEGLKQPFKLELS